jgi:hypothetical protein
VPVTRVRESRKVLVRVSRRLKIVRCKSVFGDGESLRLGQMPIEVLCGTASEGCCNDERENARHRPNENGASWDWSRWEASDIDGRTREGEPSGMKANQVAHRREGPKEPMSWEDHESKS